MSASPALARLALVLAPALEAGAGRVGVVPAGGGERCL